MVYTETHQKRLARLIKHLLKLEDRGGVGFNMAAFCAFHGPMDELRGPIPENFRSPTPKELQKYLEGMKSRKRDLPTPPGMTGDLMAQFCVLWPRAFEFCREKPSSRWWGIWPTAKYREGWVPEPYGTFPEGTHGKGKNRREDGVGSSWTYDCNAAYYPGADWLGLSRTYFKDLCEGRTFAVTKQSGTQRLANRTLEIKDRHDVSQDTYPLWAVTPGMVVDSIRKIARGMRVGRKLRRRHITEVPNFFDT